MHILNVIPLGKNVKHDVLSYFSAREVHLGDLVLVPVRKKKIPALVVSIEKPADLKSVIKKYTYTLKNIDTIIGPSPFRESFIDMCKEVSLYTLLPVGKIISSLVPKTILEMKIETPARNKKSNTSSTSLSPERYILQRPFADRLSYYKTAVREHFAKGHSIAYIVPTLAALERLRKELEKGVSKHVFSLSGSLSQRKLIQTWKDLQSHHHPVIIILTPGCLGLIREDVRTCILEEEGSPYYRLESVSYLDTRLCIEAYAHNSNMRYIVGDTLLSVLTYERARRDDFQEALSTSFRIEEQAQFHVLNTTEERQKERIEKIPWSQYLLRKSTHELIERYIAEKKKIFIFALRRGLAPLTVCRDCESILTCSTCTLPLVLHKKSKKGGIVDDTGRIYFCHTCKNSYHVKDACPTCGSWRLSFLGVSAERVLEEMCQSFPNVPSLLIHANPTKVERKKIQSFLRSRGSALLVGTEGSFGYLEKYNPHLSIIASLDSLFSVPEYTITEKIARMINTVLGHTREECLLQTREVSHPLVKALKNRSMKDWYGYESNERERFRYPPYVRILRITVPLPLKHAEQEKLVSGLERTFERFDPDIFAHNILKRKKKIPGLSLVIRIKTKEWPLPYEKNNKRNYELMEALEMIPRGARITIDPERLI
jgi:primosomal protein N'